MKRLLRWTLSFTAAVSAALFAATCAMWVRSFWATDGVQLPFSAPTLALWSQRGRGLFYEADYSNLAQGHWVYNKLPESERIGFESADAEWHAAGFAASTTKYSDGSCGRQVVVPYWFIAALNAMIAGAALRLKPEKHRHGHCASCGYDLRPTPEKCPECGAVPKAMGAAQQQGASES